MEISSVINLHIGALSYRSFPRKECEDDFLGHQLSYLAIHSIQIDDQLALEFLLLRPIRETL